MGCSDYKLSAKSVSMATTVRVPRERQFHVVPVPGVFTRGRWKCRDYREDDHPDSRDQILDFTDIREREVGGDPCNAVEKSSSHEKIVEAKTAWETTVSTSDQNPSPMPSLDTAFDSTQLNSTHGASTGVNSPGEEELVPSANGSSLAAPNVVAIDNKIEQAMDLVKTHLTFAVREEVEVLRQTIAELEQRVSSLENENQLLRQYAPTEVLNNITSLVQQRKTATNPAPSPAQHPSPAVPPKVVGYA
ncbi:unnamed protein product [Nippostrongylus brasiliensis]|uniref:Protein bunched, class 1/class 3/D/E (inferred by orthology to a D. melanogaster protein) n=1 Tax=Nippostrongylus brasiliensis TaxID=27835 RepID=A0A0N4Y1B6_NIPBR|nr:unnamed protein product [Nippostrongylus brasiliensis]